jgi:tRNA(Ile)-lysidine synthase
MVEFPERMARAIAEHRLLQQEEALIVAVSGGLDSMVLLHVLHGLSQEHGWKLHVAHFNHLLRDDSDADEALVKRAADELSLPFFVDHEDVRKVAQSEKLSIEMAARQLRHRFLARVAQKHGILKIALAHHADDQVELFFLRLLRGTGVDGLGGMEWTSPSPADSAVQLVRPLLGYSKLHLRAYAAEQGIGFREDATNASRDILRNRIRHELIPLLEQFQPAAARTTVRLMEIIRNESEFLDALVDESALLREGNFQGAHVALQRRFIQRQLIDLGLPPNFTLIEELRQSETAMMVRADTVVVRDAAGRLQLQSVDRCCFDSDRLAISLDAGKGTFCFKEVSIEWQIVSPTLPGGATAHSDSPDFEALIKCSPGSEAFDADKIGDSIVLRHWQAGDRFQPIGMSNAVKLQDLFVNQKILREQRHKLLIAATAANEIIWVEGLRISESFKLDKMSKKTLKWSWRRG